MLEKVAMFSMPGVALMIASSDWLVRVMLGPKWDEAARIFALLGIVGLVEPVANTMGWLLISQNRGRHLLQWGMIDGMIAIVSIVAGLPWGAIGVAASYSIVGLCVRKQLLFWFTCRAGVVRASDIYRTIAPSACAAACVLAALFTFRQWVEISSPVAGLFINSAIALVVSLCVFSLSATGRRAILDIRKLLPATGRTKKNGPVIEAKLGVEK